MNCEALRALYDREQRRDIVWTDAVREALPRVVRHVTRDGVRGFILYSALDASSADAEITAQLDYFRRRGVPFEWKVFDHDQPPDLCARLVRRGFIVDEAEAVMALDLASEPSVLRHQSAVETRKLTDPADLMLMESIEEAVWGRSFADLVARLRDDMVHHPQAVSVYVAYWAGVPAAAAWTYFHPGTRFASIWGGSTLPAYRRRGLYTALLAARACEARERGFRFLTVDAGPMSEPILARHGFQVIAHAYPCTWRPADPVDRTE